MKSNKASRLQGLERTDPYKALTYVSSEPPTELVAAPQYEIGSNIKNAMLQEKSRGLSEIGINGCSGQIGFCRRNFHFRFEHKTLMPVT